MVKLPNFSADAPMHDGGIGGLGDALGVSNYSQVIDDAVTFVKFLMSPDEQTLEAQGGRGTTGECHRVDTAVYYDPFNGPQQEWATQPSTVFWLDNLFPPDFTTEIKAQSQLAWTREMSAEEFGPGSTPSVTRYLRRERKGLHSSSS